MARIRSVHPSLWTDEAFLELSIKAKLFIIALWNECDDGGAFEWKPKQLKVRLFGCDDMNVTELLAELQEANFLMGYEGEGGARYGAIRSFGKFQKPQKPTRAHPMPKAARIYAKTEAIGPLLESDLDDTAPELAGADTEPLPDDYGSSPVALSSGEERRGEEEEREKALPSVAAPARAAPSGTRLPEGWVPDEAGYHFARDLTLDPDQVLAGFTDYWVAKAGKDGRKADWHATWRSWCRREAEQRSGRPRSGSGRRPDAAMSDDWKAIDKALGIHPAGALS